MYKEANYRSWTMCVVQGLQRQSSETQGRRGRAARSHLVALCPIFVELNVKLNLTRDVVTYKQNA